MSKEIKKKPRAYTIKEGVNRGAWVVTDGVNLGIADDIEAAFRAHISAKQETECFHPSNHYKAL